MAQKKTETTMDWTKGNPMAAMMTTCMSMGAEIVAFGAKRLEKDVAFQQELLSAKPQEVMHLQMQFWQGVMDDYHEEAGRLVDIAHKGGMPDL
ncbi:phasin family protein [Pseudooceanicola atlanticus]|uniref:Phasin domain-containing protein n=1 Tax=Pseudooceanicola atlanticus TaxID=1461694 RepID=A0A0A0EGQ9_9RHOB|nr:phasin family protein [Pseudooceanicola atlanticus]KGM49288.1 hypothetical protein ATO9_04450 [Pseudooceanicola atlanticus]